MKPTPQKSKHRVSCKKYQYIEVELLPLFPCAERDSPFSLNPSFMSAAMTFFFAPT